MASYNINGKSYSDTTNINSTLVQSAYYYSNGTDTSPRDTIAVLRSKLGTSAALYVRGYDSFTNPIPIWTTAVVGRVRANAFPSYYKVTYNANGGSGSAQSVTYNSGQYTNTTSVGNHKGAIFTRTGYTMDGWATSVSGAKSYNLSQSVPANWVISQQGYAQTLKTLNLYAHWVANTYTVRYNANAPDGKTVTGTTVNSNHTYNVSKALTTNGYMINGYEFTGWNTSADGTGTSYTNNQSVINLTSTAGATVTLYAQWKMIASKCYIKADDGFKPVNVYGKADTGFKTGIVKHKISGDIWR